jgi:Fuc2NAc and GlcNAc transferase
MAGLVMGFLVWNTSTRRLFMGDAGSGFLGFAVLLTIAVLWDRGDLPIWSGVIVTATMWVDATVTVVRRTTSGLRPWEAHHYHVYQHLAGGGWSHRRVSAVYLLLQIGIMCPIAAAAMVWPSSGPWLAGLVIVAMVAVAIGLRGGVDAAVTDRRA